MADSKHRRAASAPPDQDLKPADRPHGMSPRSTPPASASTSSASSSTESPAVSDAGTETRPAPPATPRTTPRTAPPKLDKLPPWRVILHNDEVNEVGFVVETIIELLRVNPRQALLCTLTAHRTGLCHLISTHREKAELLQDQFKTKLLRVTIEPEG